MLSLFLAAGAPPASADSVDDYVRDQMRRQHIPGLSIGVAHGGKVLKLKAYGQASVEQRTAAREDTLFQIQSMTKSFTAVGTLMLVEEGRLRLEDPIGKFFEPVPKAWKPITVRHLLQHTSGIKDFINEPVASLRLEVTEEEVLRVSRPRPLNFPPGERYAYSNTGYHLLGMIIRKLTGQFYGDFLRDRIFRPLGMKQTEVVNLSRVVPRRAHGYLWDGAALRNGEYVAASILGYAGGGLLSTPADLLKWNEALRGERLLTRATREAMWTRGRLNSGEETGYGLGWAIGEERGLKVVSHTGAHMTGFTSAFLRFPEEDLAVIVLTNQRAADSYRTAMGIARRVSAVLMPPKRKALALCREALEPLTGRYEIAVNLMLTLTISEGTLTAERPSGISEPLIPASATRFYGAETDAEYDFDADGTRLRLRTPAGETLASRVGPLISGLGREAGILLDPLVEARIRRLWPVLGTGGDAARYSQDLTAGARSAFAGGTPALTGLREARLLGAQDVTGRGLVRSGSAVARIIYYRMELESGMVYALVHVTREGLVTDFDLVPE